MREHLKLLGLKVCDAVSGFEGVVVSVSFDLAGCVQGLVVPPVAADGKDRDPRWIDTKRLSPRLAHGGSVIPVITPPNFVEVGGGERLPLLATDKR